MKRLLTGIFLLVSFAALAQTSSEFKKINGQSPLGSGAINITGGSDSSIQYNATDLGVVADGVTIDNANLQNALNYVAGKGGGTIVFPANKTIKLDASTGPSTYGEYIIFIPSNVTVKCPNVTFTSTNNFAFEMKSNSNWYGNYNTVLNRGRLILRAGTQNIHVEGMDIKFSQYHAVHFSGYKTNSADTLAFVGRNITVKNIIIDSSSRHGLAFHRALGAYTQGTDSLYNGIWENVRIENVIVKDPSYVSPNNYTSHFDYAFGLEDCKWVTDIQFINCYAYRAPGAGWHKENHVGVGGRVTLENCAAYGNGADTTIAAKSNYGYGFMYDDGYTLIGCHGSGNRKGQWGLEGGVHGNNWVFINCSTDSMEAFNWQPGISDKEYQLNPKTFGGNSGGWIYAGGSLVLPQKSVQADYFAYGVDSASVTDLDGTTQWKYTPYLKNTQTYFGSANRENSISLPLIKVDTASKYHITIRMKTLSGTVGAPSLFVQEYDKNYSLINRNNIHYLLKADLTSITGNWTTYDFYIGAGAALEENAVGTFGGSSAEFMRSTQWLRLALSFAESGSDNKTYALAKFSIEKVLTATVSTDATVISGSSKPVQSGGVYTYVNSAISGIAVSGMPKVASLSALKAISTSGLADGSTYYLVGNSSAGDGGQRIVVYSSSSSVTADDGLTIAPSSNTGRWLSQVEQNTVYLKWYSGVSDYKTIITNLINAGYIIDGNNGSYYISNHLDFTDKDFRIRNCKFTYDMSGSNYFANVVASNSSNSANLVRVGYGNTAKGGIDTIILASRISGLQKGDLLKIYSDGAVAHFSTGADVRKAQFFVPIIILNGSGSGSADTLIIQRYLKYNFLASDNAKVVKVNRITAEVENCTFYALSGIAGGFNFEGLTNPVINNVVFEHLMYPGVTLRGCYTPRVLNSNFRTVEDAVGGPGPVGSTGYGVNDNGSQGTIVDKCHFSGLRHAYATSGTVTVGNYNTYGEALDALIVNSTAENCQFAFNTHEQGYNISFINDYVTTSSGAFDIRNRFTTISDCTTDSTGSGISCGANSIDSSSNIFINNVTLKRTAGSVILGTSAGIQNIHINGGYFEGKDMVFGRDSVIIKGLTSNLIGNTGSSVDQWITANDSLVYVEAYDCHITSTAPGNFALVMTQHGAKVFVHNPVIRIMGGTPSINLIRAQSGSVKNSIVHVKNALFVNGTFPTLSTSALNSTVAVPTGFPVYNSQFGKLDDVKVSWRCESTSNIATATNSSSNMPMIFSSGSVTWYNNYLYDQTIMATFYSVPTSADISATVIPNGTVVGQQIIFYNSHATNSIVMPALNGTSYTLPAKGVKSIFWTGTTWIYL